LKKTKLQKTYKKKLTKRDDYDHKRYPADLLSGCSVDDEKNEDEDENRRETSLMLYDNNLLKLIAKIKNKIKTNPLIYRDSVMTMKVPRTHCP
jgi:hypothetical protein